MDYHATAACSNTSVPVECDLRRWLQLLQWRKSIVRTWMDNNKSHFIHLWSLVFSTSLSISICGRTRCLSDHWPPSHLSRWWICLRISRTSPASSRESFSIASNQLDRQSNTSSDQSGQPLQSQRESLGFIDSSFWIPSHRRCSPSISCRTHFSSKYFFACLCIESWSQPRIRFLVSVSIFQLVCLIVYMILIVYLMVEHVRSMIFRFRLKSFCQFWTCLDVGLIACSWTSVGMLVWKNDEQKRITRLFATTNGYTPINLQRAVYIDNLARLFLSFCCFFACLKCLRLCRFHRRLSFFSQTIRHVSKDLFAFAWMFSIVFTAFLCFFYFLFISQVAACSTLLNTAQMLFEMTLMKFDVHELINGQPTLGPIAFCLFILLVVFVCMSMFITIISEGFRYVRDHQQGQSGDEQEAFVFMLRRFQQWLGKFTNQRINIRSFHLGFGKSKEQQEAEPSKYTGPVERLPEKIDQLLDTLHRVILTKLSTDW